MVHQARVRKKRIRSSTLLVLYLYDYLRTEINLCVGFNSSISTGTAPHCRLVHFPYKGEFPQKIVTQLV
jgi:hypothetical protein